MYSNMTNLPAVKTMKKLFIILGLCLAFTFGALGQEEKQIIALKQQAQAEKTDTGLVRIYRLLAEEYSRYNLDSVKHYAYKSLGVAKKQRIGRSMYLANHVVGTYYVLEGSKPDSAIYYLNIAINEAKVLKSPKDEAASLYNLSYIYVNLNLFDKALKINLDLLRLRDKPKDLINSYNAISIILSKMHRYNEALAYSAKALKGSEELKDDASILASYINYGSAYLGLKQFDKAEDYFLKAREVAKKTNDLFSFSSVLTNLGAVYVEKNDYTKAKKIFDELLATGVVEMQDPYTNHIIFSNIGELYNKQNMLDSAKVNYLKSLQYVEPIKYYSGMSVSYYSLAEIEAKKKNYTAAYDYLQKAYTTRDSVFSEEKDRSISELKIGYEVDKKEEENKLLMQESELKDLEIGQQYIAIAGLAILVVLIIMGGYYFYSQRRIIANQREKLLEQKLLQMQLNPHFIFNSLQSIQDFIYNKNEHEASQYLSKFGKLMRLTLEHSRMENITLASEVAGLENYLALQKLRLGTKLDYTINIEPGIDPTFVELPPMLVQPYVENAVEHGVKMKEGNGTVNISFKKEGDMLVITVADDGPGINQDRLDKRSGHQSLSMQIIKERLELLGRKKKYKPELNITNLGTTENKGTQVEIKLPTEV